MDEYLDLREDPINGPCVAGLTEIVTKNGEEIMKLLHQGNEKRTQQPTAANEVSSRSHAVLSVVVESKERAPGTVAKIKVGKLSLIDLAGSERAANTQNRGVRLLEGANINRSLLALGNCINALGEKGNKGNFVPYRDSKLTRLLKDSLGGNCRTVMIANISSAVSSFEETLNTLKYANRAKNIKTTVQRNELNVNHHISEYVSLIANLRNEIKMLKDQMTEEKQPTSVAGPSISMPAIQSLHIDDKEHNSPAPLLGSRKSGRVSSPGAAGRFQMPPSPSINIRHHQSTQLEALRESMRSAAAGSGEGREFVNAMREKIVDNFQERMQLRRSLIELEDINVQNSIEISKRQLMVVHWAHEQSPSLVSGKGSEGIDLEEMNSMIVESGPAEVQEAWQECEQLRKAVSKNQLMKKNIAKRLRYNEKEAEAFRSGLNEKITGEDRRELMELQYQVGKLELENMELEQQRMVHDSILKGKDLTIHKLKLQLAMKDKLIQKQRTALSEHGVDVDVGYTQMLLMEDHFLNDGLPRQTSGDDSGAPGLRGMSGPPPSPPRQLGGNKNLGTYLLSIGNFSGKAAEHHPADAAALNNIDSGSKRSAKPGGRGQLSQIYPLDDMNVPTVENPQSKQRAGNKKLNPVVPKLSVVPSAGQGGESDAEYAAQISDVRDRSHLNLNLLRGDSENGFAVGGRNRNKENGTDSGEIGWHELPNEVEEIEDDTSVDSEHGIESSRLDMGVNGVMIPGQNVAKGGRVYRKAVDVIKGPRKHHPPVQKRVKVGGLSSLAVVGGKAGGNSNLPMPSGIRGSGTASDREDRWLVGGAAAGKHDGLMAGTPGGFVGGGVDESGAKHGARGVRHSPIAAYPGGDQGGLHSHERGVGLRDLMVDISDNNDIEEVGEILDTDDVSVGNGGGGSGRVEKARRARMKNQALGKLKQKQNRLDWNLNAPDFSVGGVQIENPDGAGAATRGTGLRSRNEPNGSGSNGAHYPATRAAAQNMRVNHRN